MQPRISLFDNDTIFVVFSDYRHGSDTVEIYFSRSTNGGATWHDPDTPANSDQRRTVAKYLSWLPSIASDSDYIHIIWSDNRIENNYEIYYNRSSNMGEGWSYDGSSSGKGRRLTTKDGTSLFPEIALFGDFIHLVWQDERLDSPGVWYTNSSNNGTDWDQHPRLLFADGERPSITADERGVYVVMAKQLNDSTSCIYYCESSDSGSTWQSTLRLTNTEGLYDEFPSITADDYGRHIVFGRPDTLTGTDPVTIWYIQRDIVNPDTVENLRTDQSAQPPPPVNLVWDPNDEADLDKYKVYRALLGCPFYTNIGTTTDTTYTDNLFPITDTSYVYYIRAVDLANNYSVPSDTVVVYIPPPNDRLNLGQTTAGLFTILRDGYYVWGTSPDSSADYGEILKYRFTDVDPKCSYTYGFGLFEPVSDSGRILAIESGTHSFHEKLMVPESLMYACYAIPEELYSQGTLNFALPGNVYEAVVSEILIWERGKKSGGPQSNNTIDVRSSCLDINPTLTRGRVAINYILPPYTDGMIEIYNATGRLIYSVKNLRRYSENTLIWDGTKVSAGVYFVRLKTNEQDIIQKVIMVK